MLVTPFEIIFWKYIVYFVLYFFPLHFYLWNFFGNIFNLCFPWPCEVYLRTCKRDSFFINNVFYFYYFFLICFLNFYVYAYIQFSSVTQLCLTLCNPMDCSTPDFPVHLQLQSLLKLMSIKLVIPFKHLILCLPLLLLPPIFASIRVFSNKSVLQIGWQIQLQHQSFQWICRTDFL